MQSALPPPLRALPTASIVLALFFGLIRLGFIRALLAAWPDVVPLDHLVQRRRLDVQQLGGFLLDAARGLEGGFDVAPLVTDDDFTEVDAVGWNDDVLGLEARTGAHVIGNEID